MLQPLRLSDLSPARRALVRMCQAVHRGSIEGLQVHQSDPVFDPFPVVVKDVKLDKDEGPRPELALADFVLSCEITRFLARLDEMKSGTIRLIEIREGIPRRMLVESREDGSSRSARIGRSK